MEEFLYWYGIIFCLKYRCKYCTDVVLSLNKRRTNMIRLFPYLRFRQVLSRLCLTWLEEWCINKRTLPFINFLLCSIPWFILNTQRWKSINVSLSLCITRLPVTTCILNNNKSNPCYSDVMFSIDDETPEFTFAIQARWFFSVADTIRLYNKTNVSLKIIL